jgi:hypothetical protein
MRLLPMEKLGVHESDGICDFGLFLPWVSADQGNRLWVKVIHEKDQFLQEIPPMMFELTHSKDADYGDYWSTQVISRFILNPVQTRPGERLEGTSIATTCKTPTSPNPLTGLSIPSPGNLVLVSSQRSH